MDVALMARLAILNGMAALAHRVGDGLGILRMPPQEAAGMRHGHAVAGIAESLGLVTPLAALPV